MTDDITDDIIVATKAAGSTGGVLGEGSMPITTYLGDCMELIRELPDRSIDFVITDPPYGHNNNSGGDLISRWEQALGVGDYVAERDDRPIANDDHEAANSLFEQILPEINRVLVPGGCFCCCCSGGGGRDPQYANWSILMDKAIGLKQMVIWDKGPIGMGWHYRRSYEIVLVGQKRGAKCKWYDTSRRVENIIRHIGKIIPRADQHPTEKPVELMEHFIKIHTQEGEVVLDPFMGSGTTGIACINLNRRFIGCEIDEAYYKMAQAKISARLSGGVEIRRPRRPRRAKPASADGQMGLFGKHGNDGS